MRVAPQHGDRLQRVAYPLGLFFVRGALYHAVAGADEVLNQIQSMYRRHHRVGQRRPFDREGVCAVYGSQPKRGV